MYDNGYGIRGREERLPPVLPLVGDDMAVLGGWLDGQVTSHLPGTWMHT